jgi:nicotinamide mononucleotide (NMN) deamidase PncC
MESDSELYQQAQRVAQKLRSAKRRLATTESCTGGWAKAFIDIRGSSQWFECTYCGSEGEPPLFLFWGV